jgi:hypothetical protein
MNLFTKSFDWLMQTLVNMLDKLHPLAMVQDSKTEILKNHHFHIAYSLMIDRWLDS